MLPPRLLAHAALALAGGAAALSLGQLVPAPFAPRERSTHVRVINLSDEALQSVTLIHKYSDVFRDRQHWAHISAGDSGDAALVARFHTGPLTLGRDWWLLVWYTNGTTLHHSGPHNFRALVDWMEGFGSEAVAAAAGVLSALPREWSAPTSLAAAMAAAAIAKVTTEGLFNSEATAGYKQHILRAEDAEADMAVYVTAGGTVIFRSPSGKSWTAAETL